MYYYFCDNSTKNVKPELWKNIKETQIEEHFIKINGLYSKIS